MQPACNLLDKKCVPCEGGVAPLAPQEYAPMLAEVSDWQVVQEKELRKEFQFSDFKTTIAFINTIAQIAEQEGHHPDLNLHDWNKLTISLSTHAIHGLSENDFILAAKINAAAKK